VRVVAFEQIDFPVALPLFDLLLAAERGSRRLVNLKPNESIDLVALGEAGNEFILVLPNSPPEVGCRAEVEGSIRFAGEQVDVEHRVCGWDGSRPVSG
jgi:hypothetical protein